MPTLPPLPPAEIRRIYLPVAEGTPEDQKPWVEIDLSPMSAMDSVLANGHTQGLIVVSMLTSRIKNWDFTEDNGVVVPINEDTVKRLGLFITPEGSALNYLLNQLMENTKGPDASLPTAEKKSLSATSTG